MSGWRRRHQVCPDSAWYQSGLIVQAVVPNWINYMLIRDQMPQHCSTPSGATKGVVAAICPFLRTPGLRGGASASSRPYSWLYAFLQRFSYSYAQAIVKTSGSAFGDVVTSKEIVGDTYSYWREVIVESLFWRRRWQGEIQPWPSGGRTMGPWRHLSWNQKKNLPCASWPMRPGNADGSDPETRLDWHNDPHRSLCKLQST